MHENLLLQTIIINGSKHNQQQDIERIFLRIYLLALIAMKSLWKPKKTIFCRLRQSGQRKPLIQARKKV
jgi:hypothetical protein